MRTLARVNHLLLALLGLATGLVKVFGLEADVQIFANLGFSYGATVLFGVIQATAALMPGWRQTVRTGALVLAVSFVIATAGLFVSSMNPFGIFSLLFILMAILVLQRDFGKRI